MQMRAICISAEPERVYVRGKETGTETKKRKVIHLYHMTYSVIVNSISMAKV